MRPFARIPFSLFLTTLALAVSAVPVEASEAEDLLVLTKDDFNKVTAEGVWLVEHFSPYCGHCKSFEPTWRKLVADVESRSDPGIHLAQVNCVVDGDLCDEHNVKGYPQLNLYRNGEFVEKYRKPRDFSLLLEYIALHAEKTAEPAEPAPLATAPANNSPEPAPPHKDYNPDGTVVSLDPKTFDAALLNGPIFIKFFAPWCGHCKKLAPHWTQLALHMRHKMTIAEVNCEDHGSLCKKQGVEGYPALFFYPGPGAEKTEYMGGRKFEQLSAFADKATEPPMRSVKDDELDKEIKEHDVVFLFVQTTSDAAILNSVTIAAQSLLGAAPVLTSTSPAVAERFKITPGASTLLVFKDHEALPTGRYVATTAEHQKFSSWLQANKLPSATELIADTFQAVMNAPHSPLVVLTAVPKADAPGHDGAVSQVKEIARQWRAEANKYPGQYVQFVWMDANRWASWLKSQYGIKSNDLPATVLVKHKDLIYWDVDEAGKPIQLSSSSVFGAIEGALKNRISYKNSENAIERMARYLSARLSWIEEIFFASLWRSLLFMGTIIILIVWGMLRILDEPVPLNGEQRVDVGGEKKRNGRAD